MCVNCLGCVLHHSSPRFIVGLSVGGLVTFYKVWFFFFLTAPVQMVLWPHIWPFPPAQATMVAMYPAWSFSDSSHVLTHSFRKQWILWIELHENSTAKKWFKYYGKPPWMLKKLLKAKKSQDVELTSSRTKQKCLMVTRMKYFCYF